MLRKITSLILAVVFIISLSGCVSASKRQARAAKKALLEKMIGWEYVGIEKNIPHKDCVYKLQMACGERNATKCYEWYKKQAKVYDCNTVVITEDVRTQSTAGGFTSMGGGFESKQTMSALADFYDCPKYEPAR